MSVADIINLSVGICTAITAIISVIIAVETMKQNNRMIKNSTRPYIAISFQSTNFQDFRLYVVIKNFGSSGAIIKKLKYSDLLENVAQSGVSPFVGVEGTFLAPGQSIVCAINTRKFRDNKIDTLNVDVSYSDGESEYSESFPLNYEVYGKNPSIRASTEGKELKIISYAMQDLVEKQL